MIYKRDSNGRIIAVNLLERFNSKFIKNADSKCWEWQASKDKNGYGYFGRQKAHRVAYELHIGSIPAKMLVCHTCDNPSCVNPEHLWLGTNVDNIQDRNKKGRNKLCGVKGSAHWLSKLNEEQVKEIKNLLAEGKTQASIALKYGVVHQTISNIKRGLVWSHIT